MAEVNIDTERVDDMPLLIRQQQVMGIPRVLDEVIVPHGNHEGLSVGWLTAAWLAFILSEADHRMCEVEPWAADRQEILSALLSQPIGEKDFTDDRLADILRYLSDDEVWEEVEARLGRRLIRVYDLSPATVRLDSTTAAVHHDPERGTLFRHGHSKDHRPDLAQFKVMLGALDPMGMPVATLVLPGNRDDDRLYVPAIKRARPVVGQGGRLYIGDSKMAALDTRAFLQHSGEYYLVPLPMTGEVPDLLERLLKPVWNKQQALELVYAADDEYDQGTRAKRKRLLGLGYETTRSQEAEVEGQRVVWEERLLVMYSPAHARQARRGLAQRLERAERALQALTPPRGRGRRPQWDDLEALQAEVQIILKQRRVEGLLEVKYIREVEERRIRRYGNRPVRTEERVRYVIQVERNSAAIREIRRPMGWRLYAITAPQEQVPLPQAVQVYRGAPRIERDFRRLKGHPLGIRPLYVQRDDHACGMVRLLSLALRVLTLVEYVVRERLRAAGETLKGLYAGNPQRQTARPTTERLLQAFKGITLTVVRLPGRTIRHVTPLSDLQERILTLLGLPCSIYKTLVAPADPIPP
jgi:transposase